MKTSVIQNEEMTGERIPYYEVQVESKKSVIEHLEGFFTRYIAYINIVHSIMFVFFIALLFLPLFISSPAEHDTPLTHFTVLAHYLLWGVWFPLVFVSVIFTGRSWCGLLCPMGAASEWSNKRGLKKAIPRWIKWEGTPIVSFIIITTLGQTIGVRDHPEAVAELFGATMLAAIIIGFIYGQNKRAWCRHMCPIGLLLGVYSRLGMVQFTQKSKKKEGGDNYKERGLCPTMIDLGRKSESRHCIECFRCIKPDAKGGLTLRLRPMGEEIKQIATHNPNMSEVWFFFLGTGSALGGFLWLVWPLYQNIRTSVGEWFIKNEWYWVGDAGPWWLMSVHPERREVFNWLDFMMIVGFMTAVMLVVSAVLFFTTWLSAKLASYVDADLSSKERFTQLAYQYMPVAAGSLLIGLGGELFNLLSLVGVEAVQIQAVKATIMALCLLWSFYLGNVILANQGLSLRQRSIPLLPGFVGSLLVALVWFSAIFGMVI